MTFPIFPDLLILFDFIAPIILRLAMGIWLIYVVYCHLSKPKRGSIGDMWNILMIIIGITAIMIIIGYYTQLAAVVSFVISALHIIFHKTISYQKERAVWVFVLILSFLLLLSGAGVLFAVDIPL
ncbi:MAG: hypothetical protein OXU73_00210 [Candidatus Campbellbacteria bacterium]|nr:hypothetical protein [Candidatus Campbellbacteria bacterium]